jgi:hypothetical protein
MAIILRCARGYLPAVLEVLAFSRKALMIVSMENSKGEDATKFEPSMAHLLATQILSLLVRSGVSQAEGYAALGAARGVHCRAAVSQPMPVLKLAAAAVNSTRYRCTAENFVPTDPYGYGFRAIYHQTGYVHAISNARMMGRTRADHWKETILS